MSRNYKIEVLTVWLSGVILLLIEELATDTVFTL